MNELIAGYASYASAEAILREQQLASRLNESTSVTSFSLTLSTTTTSPNTITFTY
ncbi:hypothetical protein [Rhizohabitans arisaemae]|uniref:hypothetical protein n=1 Tax=Rhizohabitans arisaemae TaxID=2720610 RepID=UPI0024B206F9|nr:hypothetical protein [Rhizohabitans arisaemae]